MVTLLSVAVLLAAPNPAAPGAALTRPAPADPAAALCAELADLGSTDGHAAALCLLRVEATGTPPPFTPAEVRDLCRALDTAGSDSTHPAILQACQPPR